jgi:hypothetical protein
MTKEVKLSPGWLLQDVRLAASRLEPSEYQLRDKSTYSRDCVGHEESPQTSAKVTPSTQTESVCYKR